MYREEMVEHVAELLEERLGREPTGEEINHEIEAYVSEMEELCRS